MEQEVSKTTQQGMDSYGREAQNDSGFQKMLKFVKGDYKIDDEDVPVGTVYLAHTAAWTKTWVHFVDKKVVERRVYRMINSERAPERDQIPDNDMASWPLDPNGKPMDPWALQYLLPMENMETGEVQIFVASSFGGRRAVGTVCTAWHKRASRHPQGGQPIVKIGVTTFPTKNWGDVKAPIFEIIGWDDTSTKETSKPVDMKQVKHDEMNDAIPF